MKKSTKVLLGVMSAAALLLTACGGKKQEGAKTYTYRDYLTVSPSNWNLLTYKDANDTNISDYVNSSFFTFNFKFDAQGKIVDGAYTVDYDAAKAVEDVTDEFAGTALVPEDATEGYAYKITLRDDLKWDDGSAISGKDFVYTMKEQLNPLFLNYRADSYYNGSLVINNAQGYLKQGQSGIFASRGVYAGVYSEDIDDQLIFNSYIGDGAKDDEESYIYTWWVKNNGTGYNSYFQAPDVEDSYGLGVFAIPLLYGSDVTGAGAAGARAASAAMDGKTLAEIKADAQLKEYWDALIGWWQTDPGEELDFFITNYTYPAMDFEAVGLKAEGNVLTIVLDKKLDILNDDGTLNYHAAYEFNGLPLVKESLYEANKHAPLEGSTLWTTTYNTDLASSASWGPYKLTSFQAKKQFVLERNPYWYGYNMEEYKGQYQTDKIVTDIIPEYKTAFLQFRQGDLQGIGIDVSIADDYKNSSRASFTPSDFIASMQLQSSVEALEERSDAEHNRMLLAYPEFREALSLCLDRADFAAKCTTASLAGFGLFNSMHYYDVENAGVYRNTDVAKQVICDVYGVNVEDYASLDEAYAAVTGYNIELARQRLEEAYAQALEDGVITATDKVVLKFGNAEDTESIRRVYNYLDNAFKELAKGTSLEGRISLEFDSSFGTSWAEDFQDGAYDILVAGWRGAAWNPGYLIDVYISPDYMYSLGWDTSAEMLTFNPYGDEDEEHNFTMSLMDWYDCLNSQSEKFPELKWGRGDADEEFRLGIIAALERAILKAYYTVPVYYSFSAGLLSYKVERITNTYNTFMGYGGFRYMTYNYDDAAWEKVKDSFDYRK